MTTEIKDEIIESAMQRILYQLIQQGYGPVLKQSDVQKITGYSATALEKARCSGQLSLPWVKIGSRAVRYYLEDVARFLASLPRYTSTSEVHREKAV